MHNKNTLQIHSSVYDNYTYIYTDDILYFHIFFVKHKYIKLYIYIDMYNIYYYIFYRYMYNKYTILCMTFLAFYNT